VALPRETRFGTALFQQRQKDGMLAGRPSSRDPQVGLGLRKTEHLRAVGEHGGRRLTGVEATAVDLAEVCHQLGFGGAGTTQQRGDGVKRSSSERERKGLSCLMTGTVVSGGDRPGPNGADDGPRRSN